ncbi:hypothetical protein FRC14_007093 [Serendipita sp. 396]|nr:hypothetical protein FRC14_007093 [Serendipita sp. 396]KAG8780785.1 hypothetical protein FRC15_009274 [Serendipita sp. 397]KAG8827659.1 hypothetical protein FRC19_001506 [Serendipita sp. 401]KAG8842066.1 hypothetical protein FRB91_004461 [Serendipita sp. 411]KAG8863195.1 hypothetical protein FRC20_010880 [Serendipita sp. 405]KAG9053499.1 hypothetical protein FS842_008109 [Serendipita sp. 407]
MELKVSTPHLNVYGLEIRCDIVKGRGIYASRPIPSGTLVEISPVLLFQRDEYEAHGRHTVLDHYAFIWGDGRMALPLGLGALFNHSSSPNVTYIKRKEHDSIEYKTTKDVGPGEELCIFYGHTLWFPDASRTQTVVQHQSDDWDTADAATTWETMAAIDW